MDAPIQIKSICEKDVITILQKKRHEFSHYTKREIGTALIIAGSKNMTGAAILCTSAALHSGIGLATIAAPESIIPILQAKLVEPIFLPLPDKNLSKESTNIYFDGILKQNHIEILLEKGAIQNAIAIGPGLGNDVDTQMAITKFLEKNKTPCVIDADGLNAIKSHQLSLFPAPIIITPHEKEFIRLFSRNIPKKFEERCKQLQSMAKDCNITIVFKGFPVIIATPNKDVFYLEVSNSGMAKGGSGDVLTGIITALLAQGLSTTEAAICGCYMHQKAGNLARKELGEYFMLPSNIIQCLSKISKEIYNF